MAKGLSEIVECIHKFSKLDEDLKFYNLSEIFVILFDEFIQSLVLRDNYTDLELIRYEESFRVYDVAMELVKFHASQGFNV